MLQKRSRLVLCVLTLLAVPALAAGQAAPRVNLSPASAGVPAAAAQTAPGSYWEWIGGAEVDTDGLFFGFIGPQWNRPLNDNVRLTLRAYMNWLQYEFEDNGGITKVSGPGVSTRVGLKFGDRNTFGIGAGPSFKWRGRDFEDLNGNKIEGPDDAEDEDMEIGFNVGADAYINATDRDVLHGIVSYDTVDKYLWSRAAYKRQITNLDWKETWAHSLGVEGIAQGNDDIRTLMLGGLVEFTHAPSSTSLMFRAGFKRSSFDAADDRTGPYFGVNFYKRVGR